MHDLQTIIAMNAEGAVRPSAQRKPTADLHKWMIVGRTYDTAPVDGWMLAHGQIFNDERKRFPDGMDVRTSVIVKVDPEAMTIETMNTIYNLK